MSEDVEASTPPAGSRRASILPPGWYPDPRAGGGRRFWDGASWPTATRSPTPSSIAPPTAPNAMAPRARQQRSADLRRRSPSRWWLATAVGLLVLLLGAVGVLSVDDVRTHHELSSTRTTLSSSARHLSTSHDDLAHARHLVAADQSQIRILQGQLSTAQGVIGVAANIISSLNACPG